MDKMAGSKLVRNAGWLIAGLGTGYAVVNKLRQLSKRKALKNESLENLSHLAGVFEGVMGYAGFEMTPSSKHSAYSGNNLTHVGYTYATELSEEAQLNALKLASQHFTQETKKHLVIDHDEHVARMNAGGNAYPIVITHGGQAHRFNGKTWSHERLR
jgi:hypothetical protein